MNTQKSTDTTAEGLQTSGGGEADTLGARRQHMCCKHVGSSLQSQRLFVAHLLLWLNSLAQRAFSGRHLRSMLPAVPQHTEQTSGQLPDQILRTAAVPVQGAL